MEEELAYFLYVEVKGGQENGVDVEAQLTKSLALIDECIIVGKVLLKMRVVGEPKVIIGVETTNPTEVTNLSSKIMSVGPILVKCKSLIRPRDVARVVGCSESVIIPNPKQMSAPRVHMIEVDLECQGVSMDTYLKFLKEESEFLMALRKQGTEFIYYDLIGQRKMIGFLPAMSVFELQTLLYNTPFAKQSFHNMWYTITTLTNLG